MFNLSVGIFGNADFAKKLGKAGNVNDIALYNHGSSEGVFTYAAVNGEKIQTLLQVIGMIDVPVLAISELNAVVGEQIIAIAEAGFEHGFIVLDGVAEGQITPLVKGTCVEKFPVVSEKDLVEGLKKLHINRDGPLYVPIDNYFNVKSVGTVILGMVKSGTVHKHDKLVVEPLGKEVVIKGIQSQDKDIEEAGPGTRVGLNLKGIEADELRRGYVIGHASKSKNLKLNFSKSKYSREQLKVNDQVFAATGLLVNTATVTSLDPLELTTEGSFVFKKDSRFILATTKQVMPRIIGHAALISY